MAQIPVQTPAGSQAQVDAHKVAADPHPGLATGGPHAGTHASGGTDPVTPGSIGAATTAAVALKANTSSLATVATSGLYTDLSGTVPTSALPALAINDTFPVASQAAMLALTAQRGDVAIRSDLGKSFILSTDSPSTLAAWLELSATGQVTSVNGQQGVILLAKADVGLGNVDNTSDAGKSISTSQQAALDAKQPLDSDLTAFAALAPPDDSLPQRKAGAWTGRTPAQVKIDLALSYADMSGTVPQSAIPAIAITEYLGAVASQAAMLALVGQRGDWCTRTDLGTDWQLIADNSAALASWREMTYPASPVQSVSGRTGAVVLAKADVGLGSVDNVSAADLRARTSHTGEQGIATVTGLQVAIDGKARKLTPTAIKTTTYTAVDGDLVNCNATGGAFTVTLPTAAPDMVIAIRKGDTSANAITVARAGTDTIGVVDPVTSLTLDMAHQVITLIGFTGGWIPASGIARRTLPDVQVFTASGTWTKPAGCTAVTGQILAGGGGGASGRRGVSGTAISGGGGGSPAGASLVMVGASLLGATESVVVGSGGVGGAAVTVDNTNGSTGTAGGLSAFGTQRWRAFNGGSATGGNTGSASGGFSGRAEISTSGAGGGTGALGAAGAGGSNGHRSGAGGGGGGGINATPAAFAGGNAGSALHLNDAVAPGGAIGVAGATGPSAATGVAVGGGGGGGGGGSITAAGGDGGNAGNYGSGGGGGGASLNGNNSGKGGDGSPGIVVITSE